MRKISKAFETEENKFGDHIAMEGNVMRAYQL
jgi:hypothetical protein